MPMFGAPQGAGMFQGGQGGGGGMNPLIMAILAGGIPGMSPQGATGIQPPPGSGPPPGAPIMPQGPGAGGAMGGGQQMPQSPQMHGMGGAMGAPPPQAPPMMPQGGALGAMGGAGGAGGDIQSMLQAIKGINAPMQPNAPTQAADANNATYQAMQPPMGMPGSLSGGSAFAGGMGSPIDPTQISGPGAAPGAMAMQDPNLQAYLARLRMAGMNGMSGGGLGGP